MSCALVAGGIALYIALAGAPTMGRLAGRLGPETPLAGGQPHALRYPTME
jgi:hypothetical protein